MNSRIIFGTPDGGVAVLIPTGELPTEVVARKDVPQGVGYKILDLADIEDTISDRTFRGAWEADFETPDGYGDPDGYWAEKEAERIAEEANRRPGRPTTEPTDEVTDVEVTE
jgi:hypothetical protein